MANRLLLAIATGLGIAYGILSLFVGTNIDWVAAMFAPYSWLRFPLIASATALFVYGVSGRPVLTSILTAVVVAGVFVLGG